MKQFGKILNFELKNYLKNKAFVGVTIFLVVIIAVVMFFPALQACLNPAILWMLPMICLFCW